MLKQKTYTLGSLAKELGVSLPTMRKLIKPIAHKIRRKEEHRYILTLREVNFILESLGYEKISL
jgi:hypothetical protein